MGKGLNKTELTGIILLVVLIALITGVALTMRTCEGVRSPGETPNLPKVEVTDSSSVGRDADYDEEEEGSGRKKGKGRKSSGRKKSSVRKSSSGKGSSSGRSSSTKEEFVREDPFTDTIPIEWDELE